MSKKAANQDVVFAVIVSHMFHTDIEAMFDSEQLAMAYMQKRLDANRAKHKRGYGGRWLTEPDGSKTVKLREYNQPAIMLSIKKCVVQTAL